ncbi:T9SS type B sorting domain-containing protein [Bacteroidetes bacterium endosymbiont of Geopemphigus sp.]|uniref:T9SS type B sorting domain-containing protein n=1 Tax=Bacteroidetes bacterium endosymbiont of Geopemphigus sp. TaxID=2047937 RepID=UPI000CD1E198
MKRLSPNADGINDLRDISGLSGCQNIRVTIFDRYERVLTELNSSQILWDGYYLNKDATSDIYW